MSRTRDKGFTRTKSDLRDLEIGIVPAAPGLRRPGQDAGFVEKRRVDTETMLDALTERIEERLEDREPEAPAQARILRRGRRKKPRRRAATEEIEVAVVPAPHTTFLKPRRVDTETMLDALTDGLRDRLTEPPPPPLHRPRPLSDGKVSFLTLHIERLQETVAARKQERLEAHIHDLVALHLESLGLELTALLEHKDAIRRLPLKAPEVQTFLRHIERLDVQRKGSLTTQRVLAVTEAVQDFKAYLAERS